MLPRFLLFQPPRFPAMNANSFPYLIISDSNWRQYAGTLPGGAHDPSATPQDMHLAPILKTGSRGYKGWNHPDRPRAFRGSRPLTNLLPRSEWTARIRGGQGSFLSDLVNQRGI